ncbi:MAG: SO_0444 family Cu/Zn efflux transporter [Bacteroidaceae bacterium]|nr:SO_0444 family Cu/Zn efflux transporter [Bacteroidaceae bacterium]
MREIFELINSMAPYLLLGFLLAGIMHAFVPAGLYHRYLGGSSFRSVFNAALLGIPLPLCSCGVIPTAMSLRKEGASRGATVSFLIATPQTGIDSIIATYSLMGLPFALLRPLVALSTSLVGGCIVNQWDEKDTETNKETHRRQTSEVQPALPFIEKVKSALHYAFVEMMQDIGKWLVLGLVVAGLITVFVPDSFFSIFADKPLLSMLLVLAFAIPMYLCATGSIPIAVALILKGLSPGTALVLLMAGPAVNVASLLVIGKVMGRKTLLLYLSTIVLCAILFGLGIDYLLPRVWFTAPLQHIHYAHDCGISYFNLGCTILLALLLLNAFTQRYMGKKTCKCQHQSCACETQKNHPTILVIKGMTCNHCKSNVQKAIAAIEGVEHVEIDLNTGQAVITGQADIPTITAAVESIGFEVTASSKQLSPGEVR